uniref:Glutamyl-tRNA(Gln) amidotransferase subunit C, mitochondrial n=1 Tax=Steinernema glaseri TaxID=37863 RepID=A0A1I7YVX5_9BILA
MFRAALNPARVISRRWLWKKHLSGAEKILIPTKPCPTTIDLSKVEPAPEFDSLTLRKLEKVSLLRFDSKDEIEDLRKAIAHANQIALVDVSDVEPMYFVHEDEDCPVRDDVPEHTDKRDILRNAAVVEDDHFVTPPGNVPLDDNELLGPRRQKK